MPQGPPDGIALLVSDIDGTLVTRDKRLTDRTREAVRRLGERGIGFTVVSSRPPMGLRHLVAELDLTMPFGAFNGGAILAPDFSVVEQHFIPEEAARLSVAFLEEQGIAAWVFADDRWLITDPQGDHVDHERRTIRSEPTVVPDFGGALARVGKIVGASDDHDRLARCEAELRGRLGGSAVAARSQAYYLDVTPPGIDKGSFVRAISRLSGLPLARIAVIGDMDNDIPMLEVGGLSIAMANATETVRSHANRVTASNEEDGVAVAIDSFILSPAAE